MSWFQVVLVFVLVLGETFVSLTWINFLFTRYLHFLGYLWIFFKFSINLIHSHFISIFFYFIKLYFILLNLAAGCS